MEIVGERWTALIVRELMFGPRRFSDLLAGLPGVAPNLLVTRLRELEAEGLVRRGELPPPAASAVYELTEDGEALGGALLPLAVWGRRRLGRTRAKDFPPRGLLLALRARFHPNAARGVRETYEIRTGGGVWQASVDDGGLDLREGKGIAEPSVVLTIDLRALLDLGLGRIPWEEAAARKGTKLEGEAEAFGRFLSIFPILPPSAG
jgi:DNA-binding HxlR family transcriptional regulator